MTAVAEALAEAVRTTNEDDTECLIPLRGGQAARIDAADYELVAPWRFRWSLIRAPSGIFYASANVASAPAGKLRMHRLINGTPAGLHTDHINGNGLDNRRSNLRSATPSQNHANQRKPRGKRPPTSSFKGVSWVASRNRWVAMITVEGVQRNLGRYLDETVAAHAYDAAAFAAWGEFARLNFSEGVAA